MPIKNYTTAIREDQTVAEIMGLLSQMALVEADQAGLAEIFLPYAVRDDGQTMFQAFQNSISADRALPEKTAT